MGPTCLPFDVDSQSLSNTFPRVVTWSRDVDLAVRGRDGSRKTRSWKRDVQGTTKDESAVSSENTECQRNRAGTHIFTHVCTFRPAVRSSGHTTTTNGPLSFRSTTPRKEPSISIYPRRPLPRRDLLLLHRYRPYSQDSVFTPYFGFFLPNPSVMLSSPTISSRPGKGGSPRFWVVTILR